MPQYLAELDAVLRALADPTRREVVERLARSPAVVSELAAPFSMALPSFMQHLRVLGTPRKLVGLAGFGLDIVGYEDVPAEPPRD